MKIILTAERDGLPAGKVEFEMSDEILQYEKQRGFQMAETIGNKAPNLVASIIKDDDITKEINELKIELQKFQPDTEKFKEIKEQITKKVEEKIINIFGKLPDDYNGGGKDAGVGTTEVNVQSNQKQGDASEGEDSINVNKK